MRGVGGARDGWAVCQTCRGQVCGTLVEGDSEYYSVLLAGGEGLALRWQSRVVGVRKPRWLVSFNAGPWGEAKRAFSLELNGHLAP